MPRRLFALRTTPLWAILPPLTRIKTPRPTATLSVSVLPIDDRIMLCPYLIFAVSQPHTGKPRKIATATTSRKRGDGLNPCPAHSMTLKTAISVVSSAFLHLVVCFTLHPLLPTRGIALSPQHERPKFPGQPLAMNLSGSPPQSTANYLVLSPSLILQLKSLVSPESTFALHVPSYFIQILCASGSIFAPHQVITSRSCLQSLLICAISRLTS